VENSNEYPVSIRVIDMIPQFYDVLFNTYELCTRSANSSSNICNNKEKVTAMKTFQYDKSFDSYIDSDYDHRFDSISWSFELPPNTVLVANYVGLKRFMHMSAFPPDASRGIEVPPSIVHHSIYPRERIITSSHVISLPLSDFSMSFNVITLVSTSFVFLVGTLINTLVRRKKKVIA